MRRGRPRCLAAGVVVAVLAGCRSGGAIIFTPVPDRLVVGAQPFALAEVARRVGLGRVVVVTEGGAVTLSTGIDPDPWLDPVAMEKVTARAALALTAADPAGRSSYQAAARAYSAQLAALDIDYRSSLADCARHDIVTADGALARMGARYGFVDHGATSPGIEPLVRAKGITVVFTEPGVSSSPVVALAEATDAKVDLMDTMTTRTPAEVAAGATYLSLMADDLARLRTALDCANSN